jgi:hypothetical protein
MMSYYETFPGTRKHLFRLVSHFAKRASPNRELFRLQLLTLRCATAVRMKIMPAAKLYSPGTIQLRYLFPYGAHIVEHPSRSKCCLHFCEQFNRVSPLR